MKEKVLAYLMGLIIRELIPEMIKGAVDKMLDYIEEKVEESPSKVDDKLLPLCGLVRKTFDIPDEDEKK